MKCVPMECNVMYIHICINVVALYTFYSARFFLFNCFAANVLAGELGGGAKSAFCVREREDDCFDMYVHDRWHWIMNGIMKGKRRNVQWMINILLCHFYVHHLWIGFFLFFLGKRYPSDNHTYKHTSSQIEGLQSSRRTIKRKKKASYAHFGSFRHSIKDNIYIYKRNFPIGQVINLLFSWRLSFLRHFAYRRLNRRRHSFSFSGTKLE